MTTHPSCRHKRMRASVGWEAGATLCLLVAVLAAPPLSLAQEVPAAGQPREIRFARASDLTSLDLGVDAGGLEVELTKEPDYRGTSIRRGVIPTGEGEGDFMAFAIDFSGRTLYLDLNGNRDLTDDPDGVFRTDDEYFAEFDNVRVVRDNALGSVPYELSVSAFSEFMDYLDISVTSGWQAETDLFGESRTLSIIDNMDGVINSEDQFILGPLGEGGFGDWDEHIPGSSRLSIDGRTYDIALNLDGDDLLATFTPVEPPSGTLELRGERVARIIMAGKDGAPTVVITPPARQQPVPVAAYGHHEIYVDGGAAAGPFFASSEELLQVKEGELTPYPYGGPLNNSITVDRSGRTLNFEYCLRGAGGLEYSSQNRAGGAPPQVVISKSGEEVASGTFDYG